MDISPVPANVLFSPGMPWCLPYNWESLLLWQPQVRMRRMKNSEKVNPTSPKAWAKRLHQGISAQWNWPWSQGEASQGTSLPRWGKVRPPEAKICHHHNWSRAWRHHLEAGEEEQPWLTPCGEGQARLLFVTWPPACWELSCGRY